jgi:hypothetical protein
VVVGTVVGRVVVPLAVWGVAGIVAVVMGVIVVVGTSTHAMIPTVTPVAGKSSVVDVMLITTMVPFGR